MKKTRAGQQTAIDQAFPIVGIGASAGGLEAFTQLLQALPVDTGLAFVLVQHLDPHHESASPRSSPGHGTAGGRDHRRPPRRSHQVYVIPPAPASPSNGHPQAQPAQRRTDPAPPIDAFLESLARTAAKVRSG